MASKCGQMKGGSKRRQRGRQQRGGTGNAPSSGAYSDAASYVESQVGNGNQQWDNVFIRGGNNGNQVQSLDGTQPSSPLSTYLNSQNGGSRRSRYGSRTRGQRRSRKQRGGRSMRRQREQSRSKKGGFFGAVLEQALVPFGLFATQNRYAKRSRKNRK